MYPLAHLYFAEKALAQRDLETVLGSIFPDVLFFSGYDWHYSHSLGVRFWESLNGHGRTMGLFCRGVISHGIDPRGLDYYSDQQYRDYEKGYCYEKARPLIKAVLEACDLSPAEGWWKAHNFIEMGAELYLYARRPDLLTRLHQALAATGTIARICKNMEIIFPGRADLLEQGYRLFREFIERGEMDARSLALGYRDQMFLRRQVTAVDLGQFTDIIERSREIVTPDLELFFAEVAELSRPLWERY